MSRSAYQRHTGIAVFLVSILCSGVLRAQPCATATDVRRHKGQVQAERTDDYPTPREEPMLRTDINREAEKNALSADVDAARTALSAVLADVKLGGAGAGEVADARKRLAIALAPLKMFLREVVIENRSNITLEYSVLSRRTGHWNSKYTLGPGRRHRFDLGTHPGLIVRFRLFNGWNRHTLFTGRDHAYTYLVNQNGFGELSTTGIPITEPGDEHNRLKVLAANHAYVPDRVGRPEHASHNRMPTQSACP